MASNKTSDKRRRKVRERIANLEPDERRRLYKHAARLRRATPEESGRPKHRPDWEAYSGDEDEQPPTSEKRRRRHRGSLRQWAEALVEDGELGQDTAAGPAPDDAGTVLFATTGRCRVLTDSEDSLDCLLAPDLADAQRSELAVGDRVQLVTAREEPTVVAVFPRQSVLSRHDSGSGGRFVERVVAANVDRAVVVVAAKQPPLRPRLIDRYLVALESGGIRPLVAVTKLDLLDDAERVALDDRLRPYLALGLEVISCSCTEGWGIDRLRDAVAGGLVVLVGQSGVGKSSLLNALEPALAIDTGETGRSRKGRHTTTASTLHVLGDGSRIIDTPGVREFGLWELTRESLRACFHEFDGWASACRYADCSHDHEPDCAVRTAVANGSVSEARYDSYRRLLAGLRS